MRVEFKAASLQRVHGAEALLRLLAARWLMDIRSNQAVRVLEGATPVASFVRLGTAVHRLAAHAATMPMVTQVCPPTCEPNRTALRVSLVRLRLAWRL